MSKNTNFNPYWIYYQLVTNSNNDTFLLKYKHLIINNKSANVITVKFGNEIKATLQANEVLELFDLFKTEDINQLSGIKLKLTSTVGINSVDVYNFGI